MKITITPFEKKTEKLDLVKLYNLVKRSEEDLLSSHPALREFILEIKVYPTFIKYNSMPASSYTFNNDQSSIILSIASYPLQAPDKAYKAIFEKLIHLKTLD
jgi:hypothetical protein